MISTIIDPKIPNWNQPSWNNVYLKENVAVMSRRTFGKLELCYLNPTWKAAGQMWRFNMKDENYKDRQTSFFSWYPGDNQYYFERREIIIPTLKMYMLYSRGAGSHEGAALAFANTVQEARVIGWQSWLIDICGDEYTDLAATLIDTNFYLYLESDLGLLKQGIPHVIDDPGSCKACELWGTGQLDGDRICEQCRIDEKADAELLERRTRAKATE